MNLFCVKKVCKITEKIICEFFSRFIGVVKKDIVFLLGIWVFSLSLYSAHAVRFVTEPADSTLRLKGDGELKLTLVCAVDSGDRAGKEVTISWKKDGVKLDQTTYELHSCIM